LEQISALAIRLTGAFSKIALISDNNKARFDASLFSPHFYNDTAIHNCYLRHVERSNSFWSESVINLRLKVVPNSSDYIGTGASVATIDDPFHLIVVVEECIGFVLQQRWFVFFDCPEQSGTGDSSDGAVGNSGMGCFGPDG
jgi:hypothetical protein